MEKLQGVWELVESVREGMPEKVSDLRSRLSFRGENFRFWQDTELGRQNDARGIFSLGDSKTPKTIELRFDLTPDSVIGTTVGIYEIDGDMLRTCLSNMDSGIRPTKFEAPKGSKLGIDVYQRIKPRPNGAAGATDHDKIQDTWTAIEWTDDGLAGDKAILTITRFTYRNDRFRVWQDTSSRPALDARGGFLLNPNTSPKSIDFSCLDPESFAPSKILGIYEFDGGKLRICTAERNTGTRPTTFAAPKGSHRSLKVLERTNPPAEPVKNKRDKE
jgi:uncharacterized protein (TIGR03067 family)